MFQIGLTIFLITFTVLIIVFKKSDHVKSPFRISVRCTDWSRGIDVLTGDAELTKKSWFSHYLSFSRKFTKTWPTFKEIMRKLLREYKRWGFFYTPFMND